MVEINQVQQQKVVEKNQKSTIVRGGGIVNIDKELKFDKFLHIANSTEEYDDFVIWEQNVASTFENDSGNQKKSYVQRILGKYLPLHPMMGRLLNEENVKELFGKQQLNGLDYKFIINALQKNAEIIIPILTKFEEFYNSVKRDYSSFYPFELNSTDNKYLLTLKYFQKRFSKLF